MEPTPLFHALRQHQAKQRASFHTPGHKSNPTALPADLLSLDYTELPDTDSLFEAEGCIAAAEQYATQVLGTGGTLFSAGGCTLCIQAMLRLVTKQGKRTILADRVLHRSAVHTMALLDCVPVWLSRTPDAGPHLPGRIHVAAVRGALEAHPDAAAVYLTSPDYYGTLAPIAEIASVCREFSVPLLVDNAHGAHLFYTSAPHPLQAGADLTADSPHKTLPVLTGGAWLQFRDNALISQGKTAMALFGSTSPSYPILTSLDLCSHWLEQHGTKAYAQLEQRIQALRQLAISLGYSLPLGATDPTRLSLGTGALGIDGPALAEHFRKCGVEPEYADRANVVLIATPFNPETDFETLAQAMKSGVRLPKQTAVSAALALPELPPMICSPRTAMLSLQETIPLSHAVGRIAAEAACPCPPGVPVVMPGEKITAEAVEFLRKYGFFSVAVLQ